MPFAAASLPHSDYGGWTSYGLLAGSVFLSAAMEDCRMSGGWAIYKCNLGN